MRTLVLLVLTLTLLGGVLSLNRQVDRVIQESNADFERDRFGNAYNPRYQQWNVRIARLDTTRDWLLWAGVLPGDLALLVSAAVGLARGPRRWLQSGALIAGLVIAALLGAAALATVLPGGGMIGERARREASFNQV